MSAPAQNPVRLIKNACSHKTTTSFLPLDGDVAPLDVVRAASECGCVALLLLRVGSGHYTAYGIHEGRWYHFNDSTVTLTSEDAVRKAKAYILFYVEKAERVVSDGGRTGGKTPAAAAAGAAAADVVLLDAVTSPVDTLDDEVAGETSGDATAQ